MTNFKDLLLHGTHHRALPFPSVSLRFESIDQELQIRFDASDVIVEASYLGRLDPWLGSLCELLPGLTLTQALNLKLSDWEKKYIDDPEFWDFRSELEGLIFVPALELLRGTLDLYRGRDYLYLEPDHLVCRCFGVREKDVLAFLRGESSPDLEKLAEQTKAGMGCRSCVPQLSRWLAIHDPEKEVRTFKGRSRAQWLLIIDDLLDSHPLKESWGFAVESMKGNQVIINYDRDVSQREEENVGGKLQGFLASGTDPELAFFLRRSRQRLND